MKENKTDFVRSWEAKRAKFLTYQTVNVIKSQDYTYIN